MITLKPPRAHITLISHPGNLAAILLAATQPTRAAAHTANSAARQPRY
ncbi:MAG: hypothetical protein GY820_09205 [Gammaproteobacteria bacterium]|nr:hypothetical protein [Gammaproteobacteria bacterium]